MGATVSVCGGALANVGSMGMPQGVGVIDLMLGIPEPGRREQWYSFLRPNLRDPASRDMAMPAQYMFKKIPEAPTDADMIEWTIDQMDGHGIDRALIGTSLRDGIEREAIGRHPNRFFGCLHVDPNRGMDVVRDIDRAHDELGIKGVSLFPSGCNPPLPINHRRMYPVYSKCAELGLPVLCCVGVPGPRLPLAPQHVELVDEVCWDFPELTFVMRHGAEPWVDLAVKLLLKWPNLYYSTSAFAPRYYPKAIVDFANTRGAGKVMYAGYFPMGLSLDRIFAELPSVPLRDEVWPLFLRENAVRVFGLTG
jgi:predicted TIM-barrel fold metal-dependent hydrolase